MQVRRAEPDEAEMLARLWYDGWRDAHAAIVPDVLVRARTRESFAERMAAAISDVRTIGPAGAPLGFSLLDSDELNQLYVANTARGTGVGTILIAEAEERLASTGVETAWLACAIGNDRAAGFYERRGWSRAGTVAVTLDLPDGPFDLPVWRYEKRVLRRR